MSDRALCFDVGCRGYNLQSAFARCMDTILGTGKTETIHIFYSNLATGPASDMLMSRLWLCDVSEL